jgi:hypothetical protein
MLTSGTIDISMTQSGSPYEENALAEENEWVYLKIDFIPNAGLSKSPKPLKVLCI